METEDLLRELAQLEEVEGAALPSIELLAAYREGRLAPAEAERLEVLLGDHPAARERLAHLAGVPLPRPPERIRAAVLAAAPRQSARSFTLRWQGWAAAAGIVLAVAALPFLLQRRGGAGPLPDYEVSLTGLAVERSAPAAAAREVEARPETRISIEVAPADRAVDGVEFGLFRRVADRLERLAVGAGIRLVENRGAAAFEARASALVGSVAGDHELLVVVARRGELPSGLRLGPGEDAAAALGGDGRRRVYSLRVKLQPSR